MSNATTATALPVDSERENGWLAVNFALTVFVSAFLLFQIEPLISKFHLALVRRQSGGVDDLSAVLPGRAVLRLRLRPLEHALSGGVGRALRYFETVPDLRVGAVGLGVGTVAAYARPGQTIVFYEINQEVKYMAEKYFSFLSDCLGKTEIVLGDARLALEREPNQSFHVLVLDAFSGDAVPAHLLTREAFGVYLRHLRADGVIAVNITNRHLNLAPVVTGLAEAYHLHAIRVFSEPNQAQLSYRADWMLLTRNDAFVAATPAAPPPSVKRVAPVLWTDHYSNLFQILE